MTESSTQRADAHRTLEIGVGVSGRWRDPETGGLKDPVIVLETSNGPATGGIPARLVVLPADPRTLTPMVRVCFDYGTAYDDFRLSPIDARRLASALLSATDAIDSSRYNGR